VLVFAGEDLSLFPGSRLGRHAESPRPSREGSIDIFGARTAS
jgi:hypothetical protein